MKILVCFKVVRDLEQVIEEDWNVEEGASLSIDYTKKIWNCFDEAALETALRIKDALGGECQCSAVTVSDGSMEIGGFVRGLYGVDVYKRQVKAHALNEAFENVVEVNTLLSGIGFENNACAGAHAIGTGLGKVKSKTGMMHGEKVAYGILVQLHIENRAKEEIAELMDFFVRIGLPLTLEELGVAEDDETLRTIAEASFPCDWGAEPCVVNPEIVVDGMKMANFAGKAFRKHGRI